MSGGNISTETIIEGWKEISAEGWDDIGDGGSEI